MDKNQFPEYSKHGFTNEVYDESYSNITHNNCIYEGSVITKSQLIRLVINNSNFDYTFWTEVILLLMIITQSSLLSAYYTNSSIISSYYEKCRFNRSKFVNTMFCNCLFNHCDFINTQFRNCIFYDCNFVGCNFEGGDLESSIMINSPILKDNQTNEKTKLPVREA